jgi:hypothetical protein
MYKELKQKQLNEALQSIGSASTKNSEDKRNNFQHLTLLLGTILGFSVGIATVVSAEPSWLLLISWVFDILAIVLGSVYLVIDADSRLYRMFIAASKQVELAEAIDKDNFKDIAQNMFLDIQKTTFDVKSATNLKEQIFILFARHQNKIELIFYLLFVLSMATLVLSFLV